MVDQYQLDVDKPFDEALHRRAIEDRLDNIEAEMSATRQTIQHFINSVQPTIEGILTQIAPLLQQLETSTSPVARAIRMSLGIKAQR